MTLDEFLNKYSLEVYWAYNGIILPPPNLSEIAWQQLPLANRLITILLINKSGKHFSFSITEPDEGITNEYLFKKFQAEIDLFKNNDFDRFCDENQYNPTNPQSGQAFQFMIYIIQSLKSFMGTDAFQALHKQLE